jgi:hypothetical protein
MISVRPTNGTTSSTGRYSKNFVVWRARGTWWAMAGLLKRDIYSGMNWLHGSANGNRTRRLPVQFSPVGSKWLCFRCSWYSGMARNTATDRRRCHLVVTRRLRGWQERAPGKGNRASFRVAQNNRPIFREKCPPAGSERNVLFSFASVLLERCRPVWSNRGGSAVAPRIRASGVRQRSHRRAAEDHFDPSWKAGRDWPVMRVIRLEGSRSSSISHKRLRARVEPLSEIAVFVHNELHPPSWRLLSNGDYTWNCSDERALIGERTI